MMTPPFITKLMVSSRRTLVVGNRFDGNDICEPSGLDGPNRI